MGIGHVCVGMGGHGCNLKENVSPWCQLTCIFFFLQVFGFHANSKEKNLQKHIHWVCLVDRNRLFPSNDFWEFLYCMLILLLFCTQEIR